MNFKLITSSALLLITLSGCGGSSSEEIPAIDEAPIVDEGGDNTEGDSSDGSSGSSDEVASTFLIQTVGHLKKAQVCVDLNNNLVCEEDEEVGLTGEDGSFDVDDKYKDNTIIIDTYINQTIDLQTQKGVGSPYTIYANSPVTTVSPISTILIESSHSLDELSVLWGLSEGVLSGDFISMRDGDAAQEAYVVTALSMFIRDELKDGNEIAYLVEPIAVAMADVVIALANEVDLSNLIFEKDQNGLIVTNLEKPLIEYVDFNNMSGSWNFYHFGGLDEATYGVIKIVEDSYTSNYCINSGDLNSGFSLNLGAVGDCTSLTFNEGLMLPGLKDELLLVYGHTSEMGTVLIFKATHWQSINRMDDGYYWFDNFSDTPLDGHSLTKEQWTSQPLNVLGYAPDGSWDSYTESISDETGVTTTYNGVSDVVSSFSQAENVDIGNTVHVAEVSIVFDDALYGEEQIRSILRQGEFMSLGFSVKNDYFEFSLISPNSELLETIKNGELTTGTVDELSAF